ncbi:MAG: Hsp20 family protein [bacterium]|nr:Hsp20 family protein [bacterium]
MSVEKTVPTTQENQGSVTQELSREEQFYVAPPVDIHEHSDRIVLVADVPGATKEGIRVKVEDNVLTLEASTETNEPVAPVYREYQMVNFFRQFEFSEQIDSEKISAELKNGVLTVNLPKVEKAKPRQIEVKYSE